MPPIVCRDCRRVMRMERAGIYAHFLRDDGTPYQVFAADLWKCPACKIEVLHGFGQHPVLNHFDPDFTGMLTKIRNSTDMHGRPNIVLEVF